MKLIKEIGPRVTPYAAILVVGVAIGWAMKPKQIQIEERLHTVEVEKHTELEKQISELRIELNRVKDTAIADRYHKEKTETRSPDGTVVIREVEDRNVNTVVKETENKVEVKVVEVTKEVVVEKEKLVDRVIRAPQTQWGVGVLVGSAPLNAPLAPVYGGEVERRILGNLWLGAWGHSGGTIGTYGLKAHLEF